MLCLLFMPSSFCNFWRAAHGVRGGGRKGGELALERLWFIRHLFKERAATTCALRTRAWRRREKTTYDGTTALAGARDDDSAGANSHAAGARLRAAPSWRGVT